MFRVSPRLLALLGVATIGVASLVSLALQQEPTGSDDTTPEQTQSPSHKGQPPPTVRLGLRLLAAWRQLPAEPTLVIVPDTRSYLRALGHWEIGAMWPVLIDDGSDDAREDVARFVRAYKPERIVRWSAPEDEAPDDQSLPSRVDAMIAHAWGASSSDALDDRWKELGFAPPGVVVASEQDAAWVAAAALGAGHGQHVIWIAPPGGHPSQRMEPADLDALDHAVIAGLNEHDWSWEALGDTIDAVTLCLNAPGRIDPPPGADGDFALTDRIGRHADGRRYAWCGIIFDDAEHAAYRAMCALFLAPRSGWIFDAYDHGYPPEYAAERALPLFERREFPVVFTAPQGATLDVWRGRCRTGIDGGYVHVNSAGRATWFQLARKERAYASETPLLNTPSIVHFIHSFSAQLADNPRSISGRWLENGAYAYIGAVNEPTLGGFVPPEVYFGRLFTGVPFGAAGRFDNAPPWKIQVIGDPLIIAAATPRPRRDAQPNLEGATPIEDLMKSALKSRRFADAVGLLVEIGRDDDALRLTRSVLAQAGEEADRAALAQAAIYAAFRDADADLFAKLYELLPPRVAGDSAHQSMLWQILRPALVAADPDAIAIALLRRNIRNESIVEDATDLRPAITKLHGRAAAEAMFLELIDRTRREKTKQELREAMGAG